MTEGSPSDPGERSLRERAVERIKKKDEFRTHVLAYVLVNAFLVVIWAISGPDNFFWPIFSILGWGIGLAFHAWDTYRDGEPTEERIQREIDRLRRSG
ncbi:MAG TPA: 2TM domain-containing protein [Actinomycetota bacterium]|nr:2TM domain-containing protein [Actinomycetota bacterium]